MVFPPNQTIHLLRKNSLMEGEIKNITIVLFAVITSLFYSYFISSRLSKGKWRLLSLSPVFSVFTILPLYHTSAFFAAVTAFFITWLANFKLLLFAFDQGPLCSKTRKSLPVFVAIAALPFKIKPKTDGPEVRKPKKVPLNLATEIPISAVLIQIVCDHREYINLDVVLIVYCCLVFLMVDILVGLSSLVARAFFEVDIDSPSDEPYLSTSLREFWGRRWNLTVNSILRQTIYKPIRAAFGGEWAALLGVLAAFLVSGLMHELLFWYVTRATPSWEMTAFFVVQGVGMVAEFGMKMVLAGKWRVPAFVRWGLTLGFVVGTSFWLFFPPLIRNGADLTVIKELRFVEEVVKEKMVEIWLCIRRKSG